MPLQAIMPHFSGGITTAMGNAMEGFREPGRIAESMLNRIDAQNREERRQMESDRLFGLQQAQENRMQSDWDQKQKERENIIKASGAISELQPYLLSKDQNAMPDGMGKILSTPVGAGQQYSVGGTATSGTVKVPYTYKEQVPGTPGNVDTQFKYVVNTPGQYKEGLMTSGKKAQVAQLQSQMDNLINTPGMYTSIPASSARDLNQAGMAKKSELQNQIKEIMRDKSVAPEHKIMQTSFGQLDLGTALTKDGKPAGENVPFNQQYVMDTKNNKLVSMNTATAIAQKQQQGIDTASVPTYVEKTGYKDVPINSQKIMTKFSGKGYSPDQVQAVASGVAEQYNQVLSMLPKDNSARREEMKSYANMIAANLGIDPRSFDTSAYVDRILPKTEMSEQQKVAVNTVIHGLDQKLDQANKDRTFGLQKWEAEASMAIRNAQLGLEKLRLQNEKAAKEPTISMYKLTPQGVATETVPASMMKEYVGMGYNPGKFGYAPQGARGGKEEYGVDSTILPKYEPFDRGYMMQQARRIQSANPNLGINDALKIIKGRSDEQKFFDRSSDSDINDVLTTMHLNPMK